MKTDDIYCYQCESFNAKLGSCCPKLRDPYIKCRDCLLWEFLRCLGCPFSSKCTIRRGDN